MNKSKSSKYFFGILLVLLVYLSYLLLQPYLTYIVLAIVISYSFYPLYTRVHKYAHNESLASLFIILVVLVLLVLPSVFVVTELLSEAKGAAAKFDLGSLEDASVYVQERFKLNVDFAYELNQILITIKDFIVSNAPNLIGSIFDVTIGIFIMFFIMYYLFKKGPEFAEKVKQFLPLRKEYKEHLFNEFKQVTHAVLYSQILVAFIQGILAGLSFYLFGVGNPVFWGFVMVLLSFLPVVGAPFIWLPAALIKFAQADVGAGVGLLVYNMILTTNIDNIIRPRIVSHKARLHPVVALLGVVGGLKIFGFIGLVLGPLIIALLLVLVPYFKKEF